MPLRSRDEEKKKLVSFRIRVIGFSLVFHVLIGFTFFLPPRRSLVYIASVAACTLVHDDIETKISST